MNGLMLCWFFAEVLYLDKEIEDAKPAFDLDLFLVF